MTHKNKAVESIEKELNVIKLMLVNSLNKKIIGFVRVDEDDFNKHSEEYLKVVHNAVQKYCSDNGSNAAVNPPVGWRDLKTEKIKVVYENTFVGDIHIDEVVIDFLT